MSWTRLNYFTFTFHFHALEKEMATHSDVLAWRIPGTGDPGGLPSMGSHRVRHNWSDLAAAAAKENLRVLTQPSGPHQQSIAYLSRELDVISGGWPHCLRVIVAGALLTPEALKIINGWNLTVLTSHDVSGILTSKVNTWMTDSRLLKYHHCC